MNEKENNINEEKPNCENCENYDENIGCPFVDGCEYQPKPPADYIGLYDD